MKDPEPLCARCVKAVVLEDVGDTVYADGRIWHLGCWKLSKTHVEKAAKERDRQARFDRSRRRISR